ncbi:hypothetical protein J2S89_001729 [Arthrobacter bambusae]|nr:hypothetical protein [Arthrobacter bambusae]MDQ0097575.1 hypothetical protein [Arthrobacter bambusae]
MQSVVAELEVENSTDAEAQLSLALGSAISAARSERNCGVLVTRHQYTRFTVALSSTVPYGETRELDLAPHRQ